MAQRNFEAFISRQPVKLESTPTTNASNPDRGRRNKSKQPTVQPGQPGPKPEKGSFEYQN